MFCAQFGAQRRHLGWRAFVGAAMYDIPMGEEPLGGCAAAHRSGPNEAAAAVRERGSQHWHGGSGTV